MNMDNYPHVTIATDGSLFSTSQHRPGFPRVLYDALRQLGYDGDAPVYHGRMSMAHGQDKCEVNVVIPLNPMEPWMAAVIGVELDETVEQTAQVALTSLCEICLADTAAMPITLFLIRNQEDPMWKQRLEAPLTRCWMSARTRSYTSSTTSSNRTLTSSRGQRQLPISSSSFRCFSSRCRPHSQHLQHLLSPTRSQMLMRSR
jgi:hypothetical protein